MNIELIGGVGLVWLCFFFAGVMIQVAKSKSAKLCKFLEASSVTELQDNAVPATAQVRRWLKSEVVEQDVDGLVVVRANAFDRLRVALITKFDRDAISGLGNALTGIALVITFVLIAWVLVSEMPGAIRSADESSNDLLSDAVARMGAKFFVSASGVFATLAHRVWLGSARGRVGNTLDIALESFASKFASMESVRLKQERQIIAGLAHLGTRMDGGIVELSREVGRLHSIEVSVKDLGAEVSTGLGKMMKDTLAEQLKELLVDMKLSAESIQEDVKSFADAALQKLAEQLTADLKSINETLKTQSGSQLEQLIEKLQDAVSGSFSSESRNMSTRMAQFGESIPKLADQMNTVVERLEGVLGQLAQQQDRSEQTLQGMAATSREQAEHFGDAIARSGKEAVGRVLNEIAVQMNTVVERLEGVLGQLAQQQDKSEQTLQAMNATSREQAEHFGDAIARSGKEAIGRVMNETSENVDILVSTLRSVVESGYVASDKVRKNMAEAGEAVAAALGQTRQGAVAVEEQMRALAGGLAAATRNAQALGVVSGDISSTVNSLQTIMAQIGKVGDSVGNQLSDQQVVQQKQAEILDKMQNVWPHLLEVVANRVRDSTDKMGLSWVEAAQRMEKVMGQNVGNLAESVDELTNTLAKYEDGAESRRKVAGL